LGIIANKKEKPSQAEFEIAFIWWALGIAGFAGFALGAHVASTIGFDLPLGPGFYAYIQTHGHLQLLGWAGLFIMGVSLHFIPRLTGLPIRSSGEPRRILRLMVSGLLLRYASHAVLPYVPEGIGYWMVAGALPVAAVLVLTGVLRYLNTVRRCLPRSPSAKQRAAFLTVRPFFLMMLSGWLIYAAMNLGLTIHMLFEREIVLHQASNQLAVQIFITLVFLPVIFAFSIRLFPLYLRLPVIDWPVNQLAIVYLAAVTCYLQSLVPVDSDYLFEARHVVGNLGLILKGMVVLVFVWKLDVLTRLRPPWTVNRIVAPETPDRRPTRPGLPDYGEFGAFEKLVYAAYLWLTGGACLEVVVGGASLAHVPVDISLDAVRHAYLMGFVTLLIFGMAPRMIPGFIGKKAVAYPAMVMDTFWLGNFAAFARVVPLLVPASSFERWPVLVPIAQGLFGLSGVFAIAALGYLAVNLINTARNGTHKADG